MGIAQMQTTISKNLFILTSMAAHELGFNRSAALLERLAAKAELNWRYDIVGILAGYLQGQAAEYYAAVAALRTSKYSSITALESIISRSDKGYRARAFLTLGTKAILREDLRAAATFYHDARRFSGNNWILALQIEKMLAVVAALDGLHSRSMRILEVINPIALHVARYEPIGYYDYLNSYAIELAENGRFDEARAAIERVRSTPALMIIPGAADTSDEIDALRAKARRSRVPRHGSAEIIQFPFQKPDHDRRVRNQARLEIIDTVIRDAEDIDTHRLMGAKTLLNRGDTPALERLAHLATKLDPGSPRISLAADILDEKYLEMDDVNQLRKVADSMSPRTPRDEQATPIEKSGQQ